MKLLTILTILVLLSTVLVSAKTIDLKPEETWTGEYRQVTLTNLNTETAIVCINDQKFIIKEGVRRNLNNVIVELKDVSNFTKKATIYLKEDCENCIRTEAFFNKNCLVKIDNLEVNIPIMENEIDTKPTIEIETNYFTVISFIIVIAVLILILIWFLFTFR